MGYDATTNTFTPDATFDPGQFTPIFGQPGAPTLPAPRPATYGVNPTSTPPATGGNSSSIGSDPLQGFGDLSSVLGAASSGAKADRALKGQFTQNYDRLMMEAQQENRAQQAAGLKDLAQTKYILAGGSQYKPTTIPLNGKQVTLPDYGFGPTASSDAQKQGAQTLQDQALKMLTPGGNYTPQPLSGYANPGTLENVGNYGSMISGLLGGINQFAGGAISNELKKLFGGGGGAGTVAAAGHGGAAGAVGSAAGAAGSLAGGAGLAGAAGSMGLNADGTLANLAGTNSDLFNAALGFEPWAGGASSLTQLSDLSGAPVFGATGNGVIAGSAMPGSTLASTLMGKVIPGIGAAYGAYELGKNKSKSSDIMSGAGSGAGIGTMIAPGIGTAVGAGVGALAGLARHAFGGPDQVEQQGRGAAASTFGQIGSSATDAQKQQAAQSGWKNPQEALAYIVMSDQLRAEGKDPSLADKYMAAIQSAEKSGGKAVTSAYSPIQQMMAGQNG